MKSPVSLLRPVLFLLVASVAVGTLAGCHDDDRRHVHHGYPDRRDDGYRHDDYRHDDYRHDRYDDPRVRDSRSTYYGGSVGGTSVSVRRDTY